MLAKGRMNNFKIGDIIQSRYADDPHDMIYMVEELDEACVPHLYRLRNVMDGSPVALTLYTANKNYKLLS